MLKKIENEERIQQLAVLIKTKTLLNMIIFTYSRKHQMQKNGNVQISHRQVFA